MSRPRQRARGSRRTSRDARQHWLGRVALWATVIAVPIGLAQLLIATLGTSGHGRGPAHVERVDLVVSSSPTKQPDATAIDVTLHNSGSQRAIVKRLRVRVLNAIKIAGCYSQGGGPLDLTGTYDITIPTSAVAGQTFTYVIAPPQQLGPDDADRIRFTVGLSAPHRDVEDSLDVYLYRLALTLTSDADNATTPLGAAFVALPGNPGAIINYWTTELNGSAAAVQSNFAGGFPFDALPCWRANYRMLSRALALPGARSQELRDSQRQMAMPETPPAAQH